mmetsp:Transcript_83559/g.235702  ORF Transcript_83559/g.235702 Transcript_83559/m.235702 type:complete len:225 (+) Transcript_83559:2047-2721(+)
MPWKCLAVASMETWNAAIAPGPILQYSHALIPANAEQASSARVLFSSTSRRAMTAVTDPTTSTFEACRRDLPDGTSERTARRIEAPLSVEPGACSGQSPRSRLAWRLLQPGWEHGNGARANSSSSLAASTELARGLAGGASPPPPPGSSHVLVLSRANRPISTSTPRWMGFAWYSICARCGALPPARVWAQTPERQRPTTLSTSTGAARAGVEVHLPVRGPRSS